MNLLQKIARLIRGSDRETDLDAEIQTHLALETQQRIERGESPEDASNGARKDLGSVALTKERTRDVLGGGIGEQVLRDWRYAARSLLKSPGFTATAILTAAIGLGAVTAMYTVVNALVLRPLPAPYPEELLEVRRITPASQAAGISVPMYEELAANSPVFSHSFLWFGGGVNNISANGTPRLGSVDGVLGDFYGTLGVQPLLGRGLGPEDLGEGGVDARTVAVISYAVWQQHYGGTDDVLGKTIRIEDTDFTIVGVHPRQFPGVYVDIQADAVVPLTRLFSSADRARDRRFLHHTMIVRRNPELREAAVQAYLTARWPAVLEEYRPEQQTEAESADYNASRIEALSFASGMSFVRRRLQPHLEGLFAAAALLLLLICVNLGNLVMSRASARVREHSVRLALGASRTRLIHLVLAECLLIGAGASVAALAVSMVLTQVLAGYVWSGFVELAVNLRPDFAVLSFLLAITFAAILFFGLLPAFATTRMDASDALRERSRLGGSNRRFWANALLVAQVSLSIALLAGAMLFWQGLREGMRLSEALASKPIYSAQLFQLPGKQWETPDIAYYEELRDTLLAAPGIEEVSLSNNFRDSAQRFHHRGRRRHGSFRG